MKKNERIEEHFQQGDVVLVVGAEIPKDAEATKDKVVEHGEVTGHAHRLVGEGATIYTHKPTGRRFLRVVTPTDLKHEEHHTRTIPPGDFEIRRVIETDHMEGVTRQVAD